MAIRTPLLGALLALILIAGAHPGRSHAQGIDLATDLIGDFTPLPEGKVLLRGLVLPMNTLDGDPVLADILREAALFAAAPAIFEGECRVHPDWMLVNGAQVMTFTPSPSDDARRSQVRERVEAAAARADEVPRLWSLDDLGARMSRDAGQPERADLRRVWQRLEAHGLDHSDTGTLTRGDGEPVTLRLRTRGVFSHSTCHQQFLTSLSDFYGRLGIRAAIDDCERLAEATAQIYCRTRETDIEFFHGEVDGAVRVRALLNDALGGNFASVSGSLSGDEVRALGNPADMAGLLDGLDRAFVEAGHILPVGMFQERRPSAAP